MARLLTVIAVAAAAGLFSWGIPLARLYDAIQPLIVASSIMAAAVLVRLNRGMPTLDWKGSKPEDRNKLTTEIVALSIEYGRIIGVTGMVLIGLVSLTVVGKSDVQTFWPEWTRRLASGAIGGLTMLSVARMAYVIWRDIDVVRLQKTLIDGAAVQEEVKAQATLAEKKRLEIKSSNLRNMPVPAPRAWEE